ncbi:MAG: hypothetical protein Q7T55_18945 [Solirubrobacteraceae bacterium]|nr:hypothetical protein [Solirubrobacteraceae bacterium]
MPDAATGAPHPEIWAFGQLLDGIGLDGDAAMALGLAGGAGFIGMGFRYDHIDVSTLHVSGWNPFQSDLPGAAKRLGVIGTLDETSRRRRAAKSLAGALASGAPFALWLDTATVGLGPEAMRSASPGVVVATALPDGDVRLGDGRATVVCTAREIAAARAIHAAQHYRLLALRAPKEEDLAGAMRGGLARLAVGPLGGEASDLGPEGVQQLADSIGGTEDGSWRSVFEGDRHLLGALISFHGSIVREQGLLRGPQATFERRAAEVLERPALLERADAHAELAAGWIAAAQLALPADVPGLALARTLTSTDGLPDTLEEQPMPLSASEQDELLRGLSGAVSALAAAEAEALETLRDLLRTPDAPLR